MTTPLSHTVPHFPPNDPKEVEQEQVKTSSPQDSSSVILTKDSLEVPFEKHISIQSQETEAGRPFLPPLFRMRFIEDHEMETLSRDYYQALRNHLSPLLKDKLQKDEAQFVFADRDPDLIALDNSLKFEAHLLALTDTLSIPSSPHEKILLGAQQYVALPSQVQQQFLTYGASVLHFLDDYMRSIGPNDASYEILLNASNQIKEALEVLKLNQEPLTS